MEWILILLFLLVLVTFIGHGIWELCRYVLRDLVTRESATPPVKCRICGSTLSLNSNFCGFCGRKQVTHESNPSDLEIFIGQLDRLISRGKIDQTTYDSVMQAVKADQPRPRHEIEIQRAQQSPKIEISHPVDLPERPISTVPTDPVQTTDIPDGQTGITRPPVLADRSISIPPHNPVAERAPEKPDRQPSRSFTGVLATFMEERSILWGEVIGGLLIVGFSIALVVRFWAQITLFPLRQFLVFTGMTVALFGLGFYSAHRWKLPTTSRGVLIIASLLVPLNFLGISAYSSTELPASTPIIACELAAIALFLFLVYLAARVILPRCEWLLVCAVLGPSFTMMLAQHWTATDDEIRQLMLLGIFPLAFFWISMGAVLRRIKNNDIEISTGHHFITLGIGIFSALLPFALLIFNNASYTAALREYAPLIAFFGVPAIATGLAVLLRSPAELSGGIRTLATSISFIGGLIALSALPIAWPDPVSLLLVALINCGVCYAIAFAFKPLNLLHGLAIAHLLLGYLIGINLAVRNILPGVEDGAHLLRALASPASAYSLVFYFLFLSIVAELLLKAGKRESKTGEGVKAAGVERSYAIAAAAVGAISLALTTLHGFARAGDPHQTAMIYAFYSIAAFIAAWRRDAGIPGWIGSGLAMLAVLQAMAFKFGAALSPYHPVRNSFLICASVASITVIILRGERAQRLFRLPLTASALFGTTVAAFGILYGGGMTKTQMSAGMLWLSLIWALLACFNGWPKLFAAFQTALALSVVFATAAVVDHRFAPTSALDPLMIQAQGIALALLSFAWVLVRLYLRSAGYKNEAGHLDPPVAAKLLYPAWPAIDRITIAISILLLFFLSATALLPLPYAGYYAMDSAGAGSWMLVLVLAIVLLAGLWVRFEQVTVLALLVLLACVSMLAAGRWLPEGAEVTAFSWFASFGFLIASLPILFRRQVSHLCQHCGWPEMKERSEGLTRAARILSLTLFVAPASLSTFITFVEELSAESSRGVSDFIAIGTTASLVIPLIVISITLIAHASAERSTGYAISSSVVLNLAVTMWSLLGESDFGWPVLVRIVNLNILTSSVTSLAWFAAVRLWLDSETFRRGAIRRAPHQSLASLSLMLCVILGVIHLCAIIFNPGSLSEAAWSGWIAITSILVLMIACLWDGEYKYVLPGLFLTGLLIICSLLIDLDGPDLGMAGSILLASYGLALSVLWHKRTALEGLAEILSLPKRDSETSWKWLMSANATITLSLIVISLISVFSFDALPHRLIVATTVLTLPISTGLLGAGKRNGRLITISVNLGLLSALIWSWAWIEPGTGGRNYLVAVAAMMTAVVAGVKLWAMPMFISYASDWRASLRPEIPRIVVIGLISLAALFIIDLRDYYMSGEVMMGETSVFILLATLIVLSLLSLALALIPGEDPLGLDKPGREREKMGYVYAAEAFIAMGLMHARITMPWLFGGIFQLFWPLIVMSLAFSGVALGELFRRRRLYVLAEPLARTGMILPLLPVFGFWVADSLVPLSGLLLLVGLFYGILSVMRHSFFIGLLAAVAGNGGLWHFFNGIEGYGFYQHPQLWLIPAALSVLAAARVNRESLTQDQMTGIWYASLMTIYISSTADIFINGVYAKPWLSVLLAGLSVSGVIAGLILRVRAFLFLGTGFLLIAVLTMIWTASVTLGWSWLWYVTGIALGIFIIYSFAMFERRRTRMLNMIDQLRQWKA
jgi:hypothetical protein